MNVAKNQVQAQFVGCELRWNHLARATMLSRTLHYLD
jgi:hypothetical protein